jgi:hypothetical protein
LTDDDIVLPFGSQDFQTEVQPAAAKMRVTPSLLAKGFIGRSVDEFKRLSVIGILQLISSFP